MTVSCIMFVYALLYVCTCCCVCSVPHTCGKACLQQRDDPSKHRGMNCLVIPMVYGWQRYGRTLRTAGNVLSITLMSNPYALVLTMLVERLLDVL